MQFHGTLPSSSIFITAVNCQIPRNSNLKTEEKRWWDICISAFRNMQGDSFIAFEVYKVPLEKAINFHFKAIIWVSSIITMLYLVKTSNRRSCNSCSHYSFLCPLFSACEMNSFPKSMVITLTLCTILSVCCFLNIRFHILLHRLIKHRYTLSDLNAKSLNGENSRGMSNKK